jgi:hypothetical protein
MTGAKASILKVMAANPRRIAKLEVEIQMPDNNYSDAEKELLTIAAHETPVKNSLSPDLEERIIIHW